MSGGWRPFSEPPGERAGDNVLVAFIGRNFDPTPLNGDQLGLLAWQAGEVMFDEPAVWRSLEFAWERCNEAAAECAAAGHNLEPDYVMARLADLTIKRVA